MAHIKAEGCDEALAENPKLRLPMNRTRAEKGGVRCRDGMTVHGSHKGGLLLAAPVLSRSPLRGGYRTLAIAFQYFLILI